MISDATLTPDDDGNDPAQPAGQVVFIGSSFAFSDWIIRAARSESGDFAIRRCERLDPPELQRVAAEGRVHLAVVDEAHAAEMVAQVDALNEALGGPHWAVAYRAPRLARALLDERQRVPGLGDLRLLPMNVPIDVWTSMFRLVLCGDFFVPGDLFDTEEQGAERAQGNGAALPDGRAEGSAAANGGGSAAPEAGGPRGGWPNGGDPVDLTPREREVLELVSQGCRNKIIAHELGVSEHTVKLHIHHIITKIGVRNRTAAATWYLSRQQSGQS